MACKNNYIELFTKAYQFSDTLLRLLLRLDIDSESREMSSEFRINTLLVTGGALCGGADNVSVLRSGLCFRPVAPTGRPVIAKMHEADLGDGAKVKGGVYVATGHGPWGISLCLGTGWVVSEMILGKETSVDVKVLNTWEAQAL